MRFTAGLWVRLVWSVQRCIEPELVVNVKKLGEGMSHKDVAS